MRTHNHKKTIWRSIVSGFLAAALVLTTCAATFAPLSALADADTSKRFISQYDSLAQMYNAEAKINVEVAAEGMVLLKNRDNALPLSRSANVTLLGAASYNLYQGRNGTPGDGSAKVELADSLEAVGISVNPRVQALYAQVGEGKLMDLVASDGEVEFDGKSCVHR